MEMRWGMGWEWERDVNGMGDQRWNEGRVEMGDAIGIGWRMEMQKWNEAMRDAMEMR